ncbi:MAG: hypothetical protein RR490_09900, partial [Niameybacter sp.]
MGKLPNINEIRGEEDALEQSTALNKIVVQLLEDKKKENLRSWLAFIIACTVFIVAIISVLYDTTKTRDNLMKEMATMRTEFAQALADERNDWIEYISTLETTIVTEGSDTTTQTVEGDGSDLINGNQYNDS